MKLRCSVSPYAMSSPDISPLMPRDALQSANSTESTTPTLSAPPEELTIWCSSVAISFWAASGSTPDIALTCVSTCARSNTSP